MVKGGRVQLIRLLANEAIELVQKLLQKTNVKLCVSDFDIAPTILSK